MRVYERPELQAFLTALFSNCIVSVFTAGSTDYGKFVLHSVVLQDRPERIERFGDFMARPEYKDSVRKYGVPKDLRMFFDKHPSWAFPHNTVLLDDLPENGRGPGGGLAILAEPWYVDTQFAEYDTFLRRIFSHLMASVHGGFPI